MARFTVDRNSPARRLLRLKSLDTLVLLHTAKRIVPLTIGQLRLAPSYDRQVQELASLSPHGATTSMYSISQMHIPYHLSSREGVWSLRPP